jgi:hypothetical protein
MARGQGYLVLSARASEAEVALSFAAMGDLVEGIDPDVLIDIPGPQLRALDVALRRRDPVEGPQDPFVASRASTPKSLSPGGVAVGPTWSGCFTPPGSSDSTWRP